MIGGIFAHAKTCRVQRLHPPSGGGKQEGELRGNFHNDNFFEIKTQVVDDQSGLAGYGSEIDFTDPRLLKDHGPSVRCMDTCLA